MRRALCLSRMGSVWRCLNHEAEIPAQRRWRERAGIWQPATGPDPGGFARLPRGPGMLLPRLTPQCEWSCRLRPGGRIRQTCCCAATTTGSPARPWLRRRSCCRCRAGPTSPRSRSWKTTTSSTPKSSGCDVTPGPADSGPADSTIGVVPCVPLTICGASPIPTTSSRPYVLGKYAAEIDALYAWPWSSRTGKQDCPSAPPRNIDRHERRAYRAFRVPVPAAARR